MHWSSAILTIILACYWVRFRVFNTIRNIFSSDGVNLIRRDVLCGTSLVLISLILVLLSLLGYFLKPFILHNFAFFKKCCARVHISCLCVCNLDSKSHLLHSSFQYIQFICLYVVLDHPRDVCFNLFNVLVFVVPPSATFPHLAIYVRLCNNNLSELAVNSAAHNVDIYRFWPWLQVQINLFPWEKLPLFLDLRLVVFAELLVQNIVSVFCQTCPFKLLDFWVLTLAHSTAPTVIRPMWATTCGISGGFTGKLVFCDFLLFKDIQLAQKVRIPIQKSLWPYLARSLQLSPFLFYSAVFLLLLQSLSNLSIYVVRFLPFVLLCDIQFRSTWIYSSPVKNLYYVLNSVYSNAFSA